MSLAYLEDSINQIDSLPILPVISEPPLPSGSSPSTLTCSSWMNAAEPPSVERWPGMGQCRYFDAWTQCPWSGKLRRGWCPRHYERWRKYSDPSVERPPGRVPSTKICPIVDESGKCDRRTKANGMCQRHYLRSRRTGDPSTSHRGQRMEAPPDVCGMLGCWLPSRARGFCSSHYSRIAEFGDPLGGKGNINRDDEAHKMIREYFRHAITAHEAQEFRQAKEWVTMAIERAKGKLTRLENALLANGLLLSREIQDGHWVVKPLPARHAMIKPLVKYMVDAGMSTDDITRKLGVRPETVQRARESERRRLL